MLFDKTMVASEKYGVKTLAVSGGVSANSEIRRRFNGLESSGYCVHFPSAEFTTDNAAMIGFAGMLKTSSGQFDMNAAENELRIHSRPRLDYENF
jgi:N6-L-threonylcarbamoyladenine synthase